jgi:hypothetical protein
MTSKFSRKERLSKLDDPIAESESSTIMTF